MTLYESIAEINERLVDASKRMAEDPEAVDTKAVDADKKKREGLYREVAKQFLAVYFDPSLVRDGEPVLAALFRIIGGVEQRYRRYRCGPIMDALVEYEIGFSEEGDLILMHGDSIGLACKALGFSSDVVPGWEVTQLPTGQMLCKKPLPAGVSHG